MRCLSCDRIKRRCLCLYRPAAKVNAPVKVTLIQTFKERDHPKNSGALLRLGLRELNTLMINLPSHHAPSDEQRERFFRDLEFLYPHNDKQCQDHSENLITRSESRVTTPLLLYPPQNLSSKTARSPLNLKGVQELVILDMTWGRSERLLKTAPKVAALPRLSLEPREIEIYRELSCRHSQAEFRFSTLRSGKRRSEQISTLEATLFALIKTEYEKFQGSLVDLMSKYAPLWESYKHWLDDQLIQRSTR